MKFTLSRDELLKPIQIVNGVVERRQALPILGNVLLTLKNGELTITATDMEVELVARSKVAGGTDGEITVPARKFIDICRALPSEANVEFSVDGVRAVIKAGRSRFTLTTLPASDFPLGETLGDVTQFTVPQGDLKRVIDLTQFAMAHQDVRYYLNGMLFELDGKRLRTVATDGHRLAMAEMELPVAVEGEKRQMIIPRKGVLELGKLLEASDEPVELGVSPNGIQATVREVTFASKLVDGRFPDYERVIPVRDDGDKHIVADREAVRQSLARASILSNEKYRAIRLSLQDSVLQVVANNPEQEEAEDEVEVNYKGEELEIGFNVSYLMDALANIPSETVSIYLTDSSSSCLILPKDREDCQYVVMPMRL